MEWSEGTNNWQWLSCAGQSRQHDHAATFIRFQCLLGPRNMHLMLPRNGVWMMLAICIWHMIWHCHKEFLMCSIKQRLALPQYLEKRSWQMHGGKLHSLKCNCRSLPTNSSQASGIWDIWTMLHKLTMLCIHIGTRCIWLYIYIYTVIYI